MLDFTIIDKKKILKSPMPTVISEQKELLKNIACIYFLYSIMK